VSMPCWVNLGHYDDMYIHANPCGRSMCHDVSGAMWHIDLT
jgi:hypothetical protein